MKVFGILFAQIPDLSGETVMVDGATIRDHMPIESANGNLLGKVDSVQIVYRALTESSIELAMRAGLVKGMPAEGDSNALTGTNYLELENPFVRISGTLINNSALREAIRVGNLFFSIEGKVLERKGDIISRCKIAKTVISLRSTQNCTKVFLDE